MAGHWFEYKGRSGKVATTLATIYYVPASDRPRLSKPVDPGQQLGYATAVDVIHRLLGGDKPALRTPENEQHAHDLNVLAHMLWNAWEALHYLPERIAGRVGEILSGETNRGVADTPEDALARRLASKL